MTAKDGIMSGRSQRQPVGSVQKACDSSKRNGYLKSMNKHMGMPDVERFQDERQQLYDEEMVKLYEDGGRVPVPEHKIVADKVAFNNATINKILPREMFSAFGNHYWLYKEMHRDTWSKPFAVLSRCKDEIVESLRYYFGGHHMAHDLPKDIHKGPCIIIGSGCSLNDALPYLEGWKGGIICTSSQASTLMYYKAPPTQILNFDSFVNVPEFDAKRYSYNKTVMITWPGINPIIHW